MDNFTKPILEERRKTHLVRGAREKIDDTINGQGGRMFLDHLIQLTDGLLHLLLMLRVQFEVLLDRHAGH